MDVGFGSPLVHTMHTALQLSGGDVIRQRAEERLHRHSRFFVCRE
jgi:hypothetical protein